MGGSAFDDALPSNEVRNIVLVGKTGNGKSSTGNSIIGRRAFKSKSSSAGVTYTCELQNIKYCNGKIFNVIDTPGLFDFSAESEFIGKEIVKCIEMAKGGIHAVLVVLSVRSRFSREEEACIQSLRKIFGEKIRGYMIVVFTGGDDLERNEQTLDDYLLDCPEPLKEILNMCENRYVLFDNGTIDESKKSQQLKQLHFLVNKVVDENGGKPFTNELFVELKEESVLKELFHKSHEEQLKRLTEMVESKLKETMDQLRQQLAEEQATRVQAALVKSNDVTSRLREDLERARCETEQLRLKAESSHCAIL